MIGVMGMAIPGALGLMGGAAVFGIIATGWAKIVAVWRKILSLVIVTVNLENAMGASVCAYCWKNYKRSPFGERRYGSAMTWVRPMKKNQFVAFEEFGRDSVIFWKGFRPLFVGKTSWDGGTKEMAPDGPVSVSFIRGTWKIDDFLLEALEYYNRLNDVGNSDRKRYRIQVFSGSGAVAGRAGKMGGPGNGVDPSQAPGNDESIARKVLLGENRILRWGMSDIGPEEHSRQDKAALDFLIFPAYVQEAIDRFDRWIRSEKWYFEKAIPWRIGFLLWGSPGTGKTSLVRAMAEDYDLPVAVFDIATMSNDELISSWKQMQAMSPCVALFEDIDSVFDGRENRLGETGGGLTFDCLLNCLSGIQTAHGVFLAVTTNQIETLDSALGVPVDPDNTTICMSSRPGRVDVAVRLGEMTEEGRNKFANRLLGDYPEFIDDIIVAGVGDTPAQFQERCAEKALRLYWENKEKADGELPSEKNSSGIENFRSITDEYFDPGDLGNSDRDYEDATVGPYIRGCIQGAAR
jgi:hypothetical protein